MSIEIIVMTILCNKTKENGLSVQNETENVLISSPCRGRSSTIAMQSTCAWCGVHDKNKNRQTSRAEIHS